MEQSQQDIWSQWLLKRRFGGDPERMKKMLDRLYPVRDKVLSQIHPKPGETLLDVGCGDGLIAFGALSFSLNTKTFLFRYILLVSTTFALVALLVARFYLDEILWLDYTYYAVFLVWIVSLNETPLDIRLFVQRIDCEPAELAVTYSFGNKTVRMGWETIWGLDHQTTICTLYRRDRKPIRFFIDSGFKDKDSLLAAITERASLNNIESGIGKAVYRHYESP